MFRRFAATYGLSVISAPDRGDRSCRDVTSPALLAIARNARVAARAGGASGWQEHRHPGRYAQLLAHRPVRGRLLLVAPIALALEPMSPLALSVALEALIEDAPDFVIDPPFRFSATLLPLTERTPIPPVVAVSVTLPPAAATLVAVMPPVPLVTTTLLQRRQWSYSCDRRIVDYCRKPHPVRECRDRVVLLDGSMRRALQGPSWGAMFPLQVLAMSH